MFRMSVRFAGQLLIALVLVGAGSGDLLGGGVERFLDEIEMRNPALQSLREGAEGTTHRYPQVTAWPDPTLMVGLRNVSLDDFTVGDEMMSSMGVLYTQMMPHADVLAGKGEVANRMVAQSKGRVEVFSHALREKAIRGLYELAVVDETLRIVREKKSTLITLLAMVEARYASGKGAQSDILRIQLAISSQSARLRLVIAKRETVLAGLNALRDRPADTPIFVGVVPYLQRELLAEEIAKGVRGGNAQYALGEQDVEMAQAKRDLALASYGPTMQMGFGYWNRGGLDPILQAQVGWSLASRTEQRQDEAVLEAEAGVRQAEATLAGLERTLLAQVAQELAKGEAALDLITLFDEGFVPQAESAYWAVVASYEGGKTDILMVLDHLLKWEEFEIGRAERVKDWGAAIASLERLVGRALSPTHPRFYREVNE